MSLDHRPPVQLEVGGSIGSPVENSSPLLFFTLSYSHLRQNLWQDQSIPPLMVPASTCYRSGRLRARPTPHGTPLLFCDSGGYVFAKKYSRYPFNRADYVGWLRAMKPTYAALLDYPCEASIAPDHRAVRDRQRRTLEHAEHLMRIQAPWSWVPVVQGQKVEDYVIMARRYVQIGMQQEYMGIGSLCARQSASEIVDIVRAVQAELPGTYFHVFGVKLGFFKTQAITDLRCISSDTAAWNGRFGSDIALFNQVQKQKGWSQDQTEVGWALPRYRRRFYEAALNRK